MRWVAVCLLLLCCLCSCGSSPKKIYLFTWSDMFEPRLIEKFEKQYHCQVCVTIYDSNESMYAKLKLGATGYDLIFPSSYFMKTLAHQEMIMPLDVEKIPNITYLDPDYFAVKNGEPLYGVPFLVAFSGIAYRQDRIAVEPSFHCFERADLRGRMTLLNDMRDALGAALKAGGHSINSRHPEEIRQAAELVVVWKQNIAKFESEQYKSGIASAEFLIVQAHSIDIAQVRQDNDQVAFLYPKEGAIASIDYIAVPKGAQNQELAHAFINFMLKPEHAAENMAHIRGLVPVKAAYGLLDENLRSDPLLFPLQADRDKMELIEDVEEDIVHYYKAWDHAKCG